MPTIATDAIAGPGLAAGTRSGRALDQAGTEAAGLAQPRLDPRHPAPVVRRVMIVAEQVQQAVQRQDLQLGRVGVAGLGRLAPGDAGGNDEVARGSSGCRSSAGNDSTSVGSSLRR